MVNIFVGNETTQKLVQLMKKCGNVNLADLYQLLCSHVHGYPWTGRKVNILKESLDDNKICALTGCADLLNFEFQLDPE